MKDTWTFRASECCAWDLQLRYESNGAFCKGALHSGGTTAEQTAQEILKVAMTNALKTRKKDSKHDPKCARKSSSPSSAA